MEIFYIMSKIRVVVAGYGNVGRGVIAALANNPDIIIADEPTGNVDPNMSNEIMNLLAKVNKLGKTVIIVTHDWDLVERFNMRVIGLKHGRLVEDESIVREDIPYEFSGITDSEK